MTDDECLARAGIAKTLAACTRAGDVRNAERYAACFTENGVLDLGTQRYEGRADLRGFMIAPSPIVQPDGSSPGFVSHHLTTCCIEMSSPITAIVRTYWLVTSASGLDHNGYYDDRFEQNEEEWFIAFRKPRTLWISPDSLVARR